MFYDQVESVLLETRHFFNDKMFGTYVTGNEVQLGLDIRAAVISSLISLYIDLQEPTVDEKVSDFLIGDLWKAYGSNVSGRRPKSGQGRQSFVPKRRQKKKGPDIQNSKKRESESEQCQELTTRSISDCISCSNKSNFISYNHCLFTYDYYLFVRHIRSKQKH